MIAPAFGTVARAYPGAPKGPVDDAAKAEAKGRFDKASKLYGEGDNSGALAEFRRAYELTGNLVVLYNIGLVNDAMQLYVPADDALTEVLAAQPDPLRPEWRSRALETQTHARAHIGTIEIAANAKDALPGEHPLEGALVELDGIDVGRFPLGKPLRASIGEHVVGILATGFAPSRQSVSVAGGAVAKLAFELLPMAGKAAQLRIVSSVTKAQIVVDGQIVGVTPLPASLSVAPGKHVIELKRAGYATASTVIELASGAVGEAKLEPREDPALVAALGSKVVVQPNEDATLVTIDETPRVALASIAIAPGPHRLHVEKSGYLSVDRDFDAIAGTTITLTPELVPTPETLAEYDASIARHRRFGYVAAIGGVVVGAVGGYFLYQYSKKQGDLDTRNANFEASKVNHGACSGTLPPEQGGLTDPQCANLLDTLNADKRANRNRLALGVGGIALGVAAISVSLYSFLSAPTSGRYDSVRPRASMPLQLGILVTPSIKGLTMSGNF